MIYFSHNTLYFIDIYYTTNTNEYLFCTNTMKNKLLGLNNNVFNNRTYTLFDVCN